MNTLEHIVKGLDLLSSNAVSGALITALVGALVRRIEKGKLKKRLKEEILNGTVKYK